MKSKSLADLNLSGEYINLSPYPSIERSFVKFFFAVIVLGPGHVSTAEKSSYRARGGLFKVFLNSSLIIGHLLLSAVFLFLKIGV